MKVVRLVVRGRNSNKKQKKNRTGKGPNCWIYFLLILDRYFFSSRGWGCGNRCKVGGARRTSMERARAEKKGTRTWVEAATARREAHKTVFIGRRPIRGW